MSLIFTSNLDNGTVVVVEADIVGPDPSVGEFGYGVEGLLVKDVDDRLLDDSEITEEELERLADEAIKEVHRQNSFPDPPPGDYD
jgi:hypothetical protein